MTFIIGYRYTKQHHAIKQLRANGIRLVLENQAWWARLWTIRVYWMAFQGDEFNDSDVAPIASLNYVYSIEASGSNITNATVRMLAQLDGLTQLSLSNCPHITDEGISALAATQSLEICLLDDTSISDVGVQHLSSLRRLHILGLANTILTKNGLCALRSLPLTELDISSTLIGDESISCFEEMSSLETVYVSGSRLSEDGIARISKFIRYVQAD